MGTQLIDPETGDVVWGKIFDLKAMGPHEALINPNRDGIELPINRRPIQHNRDKLVPSSIVTRFEMINRVLEVKVYQGLVETLSSCGLHKGDIQHCTAQDNLFLFPYDWRRDLVESAILLGERIEAIKRVYRNPDQKLTIIAHSMGGLVAKYYLMYGQKDVITGVDDVSQLPQPDYSGARNIDKIFFLGTPHRGSAYAFKALHEGEYLMPLLSVSSWATFTMPSLYEMLPLDSKTFIRDRQGNSLDIDIHNIQTWTEYGLGIFNDVEWKSFEHQCSILFPEKGAELARSRWFEFRDFIHDALVRGKFFQATLAKLDWDKVETDHYIIAGNCYPTLSGVEVVESKSGKAEFRAVKRKLFKEKYYLTDKGDYTVLYRDQSPEIDSARGVLTGCFTHRRMPSYREVQQLIIESLQLERKSPG
ncbi:MAG: hypothetical protein V3U24_04605 [Candidatus Neomarinimicrobiota bacterium]